MTSLATVRLGTGFSWVGGAYLPLPSAAGVPGTDGKWHSLTSGKAYLPADVPYGVEDSYSALPPATGTAEEVVEPGERLSGETERTLIMGIALSTRVIGENAHEPTRWPIKELPSIPATGLNLKSLASVPTKAGQ